MKNEIFDRVNSLLSDLNLDSSFHNFDLKRDTLNTKYENRLPVESVKCEKVNMLTSAYNDRDYNVGAYYGKLLHEDRYIVIPQGVGVINKRFNTYYSTAPEYYTSLEEAAKRVVRLYTTLIETINNVYD